MVDHASPHIAHDGTSLLATAAALAIELHAGQVRKGTTIPYVQHPLEVAATALRHGASPAQAAAALLHDVVEDCGGPPVLERVRACCGDAVAAMVMACTDAAPAPGEAKPPWRERKEAYLAHLEHVPVDALLVSAADKLSNAAAIVRDLEDPAVGAAVWDRFTAGREGQRWYYAALAEVLGRRLPGPLADELAAMVGRLLARSAAG
jgi:(p)ppGpp synthase/HD superfamily hydrolase